MKLLRRRRKTVSIVFRRSCVSIGMRQTGKHNCKKRICKKIPRPAVSSPSGGDGHRMLRLLIFFVIQSLSAAMHGRCAGFVQTQRL